MAGDLPKVPYLAGEMVPTFVVPAKSAAINSAAAQEVIKMASGVTIPVWLIVVVGIGIAVYAHVLGGNVTADPNQVSAQLTVRNPVPIVGVGDPRLAPPFKGLTADFSFGGTSPVGQVASAQIQRYQPQPGDQCDEATSWADTISQAPNGVTFLQWDESICAYHFKPK